MRHGREVLTSIITLFLGWALTEILGQLFGPEAIWPPWVVAVIGTLSLAWIWSESWLPPMRELLSPSVVNIGHEVDGNRLLAWYFNPKRELSGLEFRVTGLERSHGWRKWYKHPKLSGGVVVTSDYIQPGQSMKPYPFVYPSGARWSVGRETVDLQPGVWRLVLEVRGKDGETPIAQEGKIGFRFDGENIET